MTGSLNRRHRRRIGNRDLLCFEFCWSGQPPEDDCANLVFRSMVDHHLNDPQTATNERHRLLRPGGHVFIRKPVANEAVGLNVDVVLYRRD